MRFEEQTDCYIDTKTGIKWSKENFGPMTWDEAIKAPKGWRLPSADELKELVDFKNYQSTELLDMLPTNYWTSTLYEHSNTHVFVVHFGNGRQYPCFKSGNYYARYVKEM